MPSVKAPADRVERKIVPCFAKPLQTTVLYLRPLQKQKLASVCGGICDQTPHFKHAGRNFNERILYCVRKSEEM